MYDKHFFQNSKYKKKIFDLKFCVSSQTLTKDFFHTKTQCVIGSYRADNLRMVTLATKVNFDIFKWNYIPNVNFCIWLDNF